jgi:hypothetical protein
VVHPDPHARFALDHADAERSDSPNRFREIRSGVLTLHYYGHDRDEVAMTGFREPRLTGYGND